MTSLEPAIEEVRQEFPDAEAIGRIDRAQACLVRARSEPSEASASSMASELTYHLDMVLRVITGIRIMSGELDDAPLAVTPLTRAMETTASRRL